MIKRHIRLYDVNVYDDSKLKQFTIQLFGLDRFGKSYSLIIFDYKPFFYVGVPISWTRDTALEFGQEIRSISGVGENLSSVDLERHRKLIGYDESSNHNFVRLSFRNIGAFQRVKRLWFESSESDVLNTRRVSENIKCLGFPFRGESTFLYEAHIPPLLRMYHILNISPSGWICVPEERVFPQRKGSKTSCDYEGTISYTSIEADNTKEDRVPYKVCSFDIEANSSHGDFPLPIKSFRKLASEIIQHAIDTETTITTDVLTEAITSAIYDDISSNRHISPVYLKEKAKNDGLNIYKMVERILENKVSKILTLAHKREKDKQMLINDYFVKSSDKKAMDKIDAGLECEHADVDDGEDYKSEEESNCAESNNGEDCEKDEGEGVGIKTEDQLSIHSRMRRGVYNTRQPEYRYTLFDFLNFGEKQISQYYKKGSKKSWKDDKISVLDEAIMSIFPCGVKGDEITFIGSVFFHYGESDSYLNHCIVLDTCSSVSDATIECYSTEAEVLKAWKKLILKEDPDIILGYNIFGFDYEFMFRRAMELEISYDFLTTLSKNRGESCYTQNRDGVVSISEQKIVLASGEHNLSYIKMAGRVQVDLFNLIRREYNLPSYKLDYVAGHFIGDSVLGIDVCGDITIVRSKNLMGLYNEAYVCFEITEHSSEMYKNSEKFMVHNVSSVDGMFELHNVNVLELQGKNVRWGLAKDDVTPQDIFRLTRKGPDERALVAKYCIQDCRLPMHIFNKIDAMTSFIEMAKLCSVPISFIVLRGQGIKLTSYLAKKCRDMNTLIPTISKSFGNEAYEGAIVLEPKCDLYLDIPISCVDYGSLYPSSMISENISHDTKASTKEYNLEGELISYKGKDIDEMLISKSVPYRDITYDTYKWISNPNGGKAKKHMVGKKTCRYVQPDSKTGNGIGIIPAILKELLAARKATRKQIQQQTDPFMKNVLDKRQLSIKVTANSIYGQCGAKTSTFYDMDVAASTTAIGRELLIFARDQIEKKYAKGYEVMTEKYGMVKTDAKCVYGDTDSAFMSFGLMEMDGKTKIVGRKALEISIALGEEAGEFITRQLKSPHVLEYEKTFLPFCLLSKKRYVGMLYETDPDKCERKSMGIVLKRRDNAPIVKDVYGGIIDILMKTQNITEATRFLNSKIEDIIAGRCPMQKLIITKSLRSQYANPKQIAHKVLADRIAERDPGNAPSAGDRIAYVHVHVPTRSKVAEKALLTGDKIELPEMVITEKLQIDYSYYLTNQIMKPVQQVFALVLEMLPGFYRYEQDYNNAINKLYDNCFDGDEFYQKRADVRSKIVKKILFDSYLTRANNAKSGQIEIGSCFKLNSTKIDSKENAEKLDVELNVSKLNSSKDKVKAVEKGPLTRSSTSQSKITNFFK